MNCSKCGAPLMENDQFCRNCGASVNEENAQNVMNNNYQQAYNQPMYNQQPQNNNMKFMIIVGILVIGIVAIIVAIIFGLNNNNKNSVNTGLNNSNITNESVNKDNNSDSDATTVKKNSGYKVKFNGFKFEIPTDLIYENAENSIVVGDEDGTWTAYIEVIEGAYNQIVTNKNKLQGVYTQQGYKASSAVEQTIGDMPFITIELSKSGLNAVVGIAKANSMNLFGITTYNVSNEFDYDVIKILADILSTAEYTGETNNISTFEKIDLTGISSVAK